MNDPIALFRSWYTDARTAGLPMPEAMVLATATPDGKPAVRWVLLKGVDEYGRFQFYTNLESRKAAELAVNPRAALALYWEPLHRQVRIDGTVEPIPDAEADAYWHSRHRGSQISAFVSPQSRPAPERATMEQKRAEAERHYEGREIPRPRHWGGYGLVPVTFEFWEGREHRFHERIVFERDEDGVWRESRLWP
jgi:pyridoxamine 5'-phosphate oxidase